MRKQDAFHGTPIADVIIGKDIGVCKNAVLVNTPNKIVHIPQYQDDEQEMSELGVQYVLHNLVNILDDVISNDHGNLAVISMSVSFANRQEPAELAVWRKLNV